jgi:hypothetical protein
MARYPEDPNGLIRDATELNARVRTLRSEGWTVTLEVAENGTRLCVKISTVRACDPPKPEASE